MLMKTTKKLPNMLLKKGAVVYSVNDPSDCVYLVKVGAVQIETKYGMVLGELGEGELFGEVGLITNEPRTVTVKAKVDSVVIKIDEPTFREKLQQADPSRLAEQGQEYGRDQGSGHYYLSCLSSGSLR